MCVCVCVCALMRESTCSGEGGLTADKRAICLGAPLWKEAEAERCWQNFLCLWEIAGVWFPLAPGSERFPDLYSRFLLVLPDLLGPYKDMNTFHVGVQSNIQDASWNKIGGKERVPTDRLVNNCWYGAFCYFAFFLLIGWELTNSWLVSRAQPVFNGHAEISERKLKN